MMHFCHLGQAICWRLVGMAGAMIALASATGCAQLFTHELRPYTYKTLLAEGVESPLNVIYFGTTSLLFEGQKSNVMVDGFVSRPGVFKLLFSALKPDREYIGRLQRSNWIPKNIDTVLVTHAHHDHSLDSAYIACLTDAKLWGPDSVLALANSEPTSKSGEVPCKHMHGKALPEVIISSGEFTITPFDVYHSPLELFSGEVRPDPQLAAWVGTYRSGSTLSYLLRQQGISVLVSSGLPRKQVSPLIRSADIVFLSIGGLLKKHGHIVEQTWDEVVCKTGAKVVVPTHWDLFTTPLEEPLRVMPRPFANFDATMEVLEKLAERDDVALHFLPPLTRFDVRTLVKYAPLSRKGPRHCGQGVTN